LLTGPPVSRGTNLAIKTTVTYWPEITTETNLPKSRQITIYCGMNLGSAKQHPGYLKAVRLREEGLRNYGENGVKLGTHVRKDDPRIIFI
jgi:hypothetical protein